MTQCTEHWHDILFTIASDNLATASNPVKIGNVRFWVDEQGPWEGELSFDLPMNLWNSDAIERDAHKMVRNEF